MRFDDTTGFLVLGEQKQPQHKKKPHPLTKQLADNSQKQLDKLEELINQNKKARKENKQKERIEKTQEIAKSSSKLNSPIDSQKLEKAVDTLGEQYTAGAKEIQSGVMSLKERFMTPLKWLSKLKPKKEATNASEKVKHTPLKKHDIFKAKDDEKQNSKSSIFLGGGIKGLLGKIIASALGGFGLKKLLGAVFSKAFLKGVSKKGLVVASALSLVNSIADGMARVRKYLGLSSTDETTIANKLAGITTGIVNGVSSLLNIISFGLIPKLNEDNVAKTVTEKFNSIAEDISTGLDNLAENVPIVGNSAKKLLEVVNNGMAKAGEGWEKLALETEDIFTQVSDLFRKQSEAEKVWKEANKKWWNWDWKPDFVKSDEEKEKELKNKAEKAKAVIKDKEWLKHASKKDKLEAQNAINTYNTKQVNKKVEKNNDTIRVKKEEYANAKKYLKESKTKLKELKEKYQNSTDPEEKKKLKIQIDAYELSVKNLTSQIDTLGKGIKDLIDANMKLIEGLKDVKLKTNEENINDSFTSNGNEGGKATVGLVNGKRVVIYPNGEKKIGGHRNWRNNNAGNLEYGKFAKAHGAIGTDGRFAIFPSMEAGYKAQASLLKTKRYRSKTLAQAINTYAPSFENDTQAYVNSVSRATGIPPNTPMSSLSDTQLNRVVKAMAKHEGMKKGRVERVALSAQNKAPVTSSKKVAVAKKITPTKKVDTIAHKNNTKKEKKAKSDNSSDKIIVNNDNKAVVEAISKLHDTITKQNGKSKPNTEVTKSEDTIIHKPLKLSLKDRE